jgi:hypothetical protein
VKLPDTWLEVLIPIQRQIHTKSPQKIHDRHCNHRHCCHRSHLHPSHYIKYPTLRQHNPVYMLHFRFLEFLSYLSPLVGIFPIFDQINGGRYHLWNQLHLQIFCTIYDRVSQLGGHPSDYRGFGADDIDCCHSDCSCWLDIYRLKFRCWIFVTEYKTRIAKWWRNR